LFHVALVLLADELTLVFPDFYRWTVRGVWTNSFSWYLLLLKLVGGLRMYIGVTIKRYLAVKEVGKIKMSVGIITYYQLIQVCQVNLFFYFSILFSFSYLNPHMNVLECLWYIGGKFLFVVTVVLQEKLSKLCMIPLDRF
jgi:hypothetical protein